MSSSRRELFVYYRVRAGNEGRAVAIVDAFQHDLMRRTRGLHARRLRKDEVGHGDVTWMETYAIDPLADDGTIGVDGALEADIERAASMLADCIDGVRHVEAFFVND